MSVDYSGDDPLMAKARTKLYETQQRRQRQSIQAFKVMVIGPKAWKDGKTLLEAIQGSEATELIVGNDAGAERMARHIALHLDLKVVDFENNWDEGQARALRYDQFWTEGRPDMVIACVLPHANDIFDAVRRAKRGGVPVAVLLPDPKIHPPDPTWDNGYTPKEIA